jgi:hypothetical protein
VTAYQERERARKQLYEQHRPSLTCVDCPATVSKSALRCVPCNLRLMRSRLKGNPRLREAVGNRTPTRGELRLIRRTPPVPSIMQGLAIIEKWQRG